MSTTAQYGEADRTKQGYFTSLATSLRSPLIADALDAKGLRNQCLGSGIGPLVTGTVMVGSAFPVSIAKVDSTPPVPYVGLLEALDAIGPGDIFVAAANGAGPVAVWGELVATASRGRGALGSLCDGYSRDSAVLRQMGFPVFCRGTVPYDSNGRSEVIGHESPVTIDGVRISMGDLVVADDDGVVIVPSAIIDEIVAAAILKDSHESDFRKAVRAGMSATEAFRKFGVL